MQLQHHTTRILARWIRMGFSTPPWPLGHKNPFHRKTACVFHRSSKLAAPNPAILPLRRNNRPASYTQLLFAAIDNNTRLEPTGYRQPIVRQHWSRHAQTMFRLTVKLVLGAGMLPQHPKAMQREVLEQACSDSIFIILYNNQLEQACSTT